ncbi:MAG: pirin family protein [Cyanobacteriota bacterium]|nr:pirin family protein [Cyanobacteriota bacterium]
MTAAAPSAAPLSAGGLLHRPAAERFHSRLDWLDSWHTFSFSSHFDPAWMGFGPLRVINDDTIAAGQGFGMHPHRDMEIITVMVEGQLNHRDSMGHGAVLHAGEVQRMSAGSGIVHSEINAGESPCRLLQIWIEPDSRGLPPAYEQKPFPQELGWTPLIDPEGAGGAMAIQGATRLWRGRATPGQTLPPPASPDRIGWIQMIAGEVALRCESATVSAEGSGETGAKRVLAPGDGLGFAPAPGTPAIRALTAGPQGADLLWFALA